VEIRRLSVFLWLRFLFPLVLCVFAWFCVRGLLGFVAWCFFFFFFFFFVGCFLLVIFFFFSLLFYFNLLSIWRWRKRPFPPCFPDCTTLRCPLSEDAWAYDLNSPITPPFKSPLSFESLVARACPPSMESGHDARFFVCCGSPTYLLPKQLGVDEVALSDTYYFPASSFFTDDPRRVRASDSDLFPFLQALFFSRVLPLFSRSASGFLPRTS